MRRPPVDVGALGASAWVVASNAPARINAFAAILQVSGYPVWVCDGVADDREIQAAIDALPAGEGTVHLSKGTFHLGKITVDLPLQSQIILKSDIVLEGSGWGTVLRPINGLTLPQESSVIAFHDYPTANYDRATVRDLQIDGNKANVVSPISGITYYNVYDTVVENVYVKNTKGHGIQPYGGGGRHRIINNLVTGAFVCGIYIDTVTDCIVVGNTIINSQYNNIWIDGPNTKRNTIVGNICSGGNYSIGFVRGSSDNTVTGNNFYNAAARAVDFEGLTADSHDNIVSGNIITPGSGVPAVVLGSTAACNKNIITGNVMVVTGATAAVIISNASSNNLISQNRISTANGYSVIIAAVSNNNIINKNILTSTAGQYISDAGTGTIVRDNQGYLTENSGTATITATLAAPGAATATDSGVAGNVDIGAHSWKVTFTGISGGETIGGTKSNVVTIATSAKRVDLTAVPTGPTGTLYRKIYRTVAGDAGDYKLVGTISDNTTTTFADNVADASLGAAAPTSNTTGLSVVVTHGLAATPTRTTAEPTSDPGAANAFWRDTYGATTFKINAKVGVTTATTFDWRAQVGEG